MVRQRGLFRAAALELKSAIRAALGIPDPWKQFRRFESRIHPDTWARQAEILDSLPDPCEEPESDSADLRTALDLRADVLGRFRDHWKPLAGFWRVLIHLPDFGVSPAGYSLFRNLGAGLAWLGVPVRFWDYGSPLGPHLDDFRPTVLLSIDHVWYRLASDGPDTADALAYQRECPLALGLSSNHGTSDPAVLGRQLAVARDLGVTFFYSFQCPAYVERHYRAFAAHGFAVASVEFGANPLVYFPLPGVRRDLEFVFLASSNAEKWGRYFEYLPRLLARHPGLIVGPGWSRSGASSLPDEQANRLYARARVGLNLHVPFQIAEPSELNERAYNLAAAAVPQLLDRPALLPDRLSQGAVFTADNPAEYEALFAYILDHPEEAFTRGVRSMQEVLSRHTLFHRADALLRFVAERGGWPVASAAPTFVQPPAATERRGGPSPSSVGMAEGQ